eukprot:GFUD01038565.1.p1 GENE.GFUD01038565.1~~GFUD01038565.1.p1  ORF type:complete len:296 (+),score=79.26 GFUD01038565.1:101-988(+)
MESCSKVTKSRCWVGDKGRGDLTILQWNILAQTLGIHGDFPCPLEFLSLDHRLKRIFQEILYHNADVICLQEVDIFNDILEELSKHGYAGIFVKKPNSFCLSFEENHGPDGSAIFYKKDTVSLLAQHCTILNLSDQTPTNSALLQTDFVHTKTKKHFTVCTTHLKAGSKWSDIRTQQTQSIATELRAKTNYILAGDFNGEPKEEFYNLLKRDLGLNSAFEKLLGTEPAYTTWKKRKSFEQESKKVEDYIFFHPENFSCSSLLDLPSEESLGSDLLPNNDYSSDHLSLVAEFSFNT